MEGQQQQQLTVEHKTYEDHIIFKVEGPSEQLLRVDIVGSEAYDD